MHVCTFHTNAPATLSANLLPTSKLVFVFHLLPIPVHRLHTQMWSCLPLPNRFVFLSTHVYTLHTHANATLSANLPPTLRCCLFFIYCLYRYTYIFVCTLHIQRQIAPRCWCGLAYHFQIVSISNLHMFVYCTQTQMQHRVRICL